MSVSPEDCTPMNEKMKARRSARIDSPLSIWFKSKRCLARKQGHLHSDVKLSGQESARNNDRDNNTTLPPPILHAVFIGCWIIILFRGVLGILDKNTFDGRSNILASMEEVDEHVTAGHANLEEGEHEHHQDSRPKEPVTRRRSVEDHIVVFERHGIVAHVLKLNVSQSMCQEVKIYVHRGRCLDQSVCPQQGRS
jgi:hypothetical protein